MTIGSSPVYLYIGTLTIISYNDGGYPDNISSGTMTARTPTTLIDGKTLATAAETIYYQYQPALVEMSRDCYLSISGFSSDPGIGYFTYAQWSGFALQYTSSAAYGYSAGTATWSWGSTTFGFYGTTGAQLRLVR